MTKNDLLNQARKEVLVNKNYKKAVEILNSIKEIEDIEIFYNTLGLAYLESGEYGKAAEIYKQSGKKYPAGFCELLSGNEEAAKKLWESAPDSSPCRWGKCVLDFIKLRKGPVPTYLQIRNHLETDLGYFIQADKLRYAENLMKNDTVFISVNLESYKLIGRVLLNFGFMNMAKKYFIKSLGVVPDDAESYYYLGQYYYKIGAYGDSKSAIEKSLAYNQSHTPSRKLLGKLELKLR
ncbi:MAG: hypothetical protein A2Y25_10670 [Candidatus Melainabacteria bacterium GWF2_37_15]|nr:MAG: hypothetical protein A2Y25_10670 [Candidatus Melainabacteria bacterium GWF2_37_15]